MTGELEHDGRRAVTTLAPTGAAWGPAAVAVPLDPPDGVGDPVPTDTALGATYDVVGCLGTLGLDDALWE